MRDGNAEGKTKPSDSAKNREGLGTRYYPVVERRQKKNEGPGHRPMTSRNRRRAKQAEEKRQSSRVQWLKTIGGFVIGAIFGLYVVHLFVALLPGPKIAVQIGGLKVTSGNATGCTVYQFMVATDEPIEYAYWKIQFASKITGFQVGFPQEAETAATGRTNLQAWEVGRDAKGECALVQAAVNNTSDIQVSAVGNMLAASVTKLASKSTIMGLAVTSDSESTVNPSPQMYSEGAYEYSNLGQTVRKPLHFENRGVTTTK